MFLTYQYQLRPTKAQHRGLERILEMQRLLYNASLQERIDSWRFGKSLAALRGSDKPDPKLDDWEPVTRFHQHKSLTKIRTENPEGYGALPANLLRDTVNRVDLAFKAFFSRLKTLKGKAGYPRFRPMSRWDSFGFAEFSGIRLIGSKLFFSGLCGGLKVHMHRPLPEGATIQSCRFNRGPKGWSLALQVEVADTVPVEGDNRPAVGIDLGILSLAALSDGKVIDNPRIGKKAARAMKLQRRALSRCSRGSARRKAVKAKLGRALRKVANTRRTFLHQQSARLARDHSLIAVEDLAVKGMTASAKGTAEEPGKMVRQKAGLNREFLDVAPATFVSMLSYKAERAGGRLVKVDPRWTSQDCSGCGERAKKELSQRIHRCACGLILDRDINAARNILAKAVVGLEGGKQAFACSS